MKLARGVVALTLLSGLGLGWSAESRAIGVVPALPDLVPTGEYDNAGLWMYVAVANRGTFIALESRTRVIFDTAGGRFVEEVSTPRIAAGGREWVRVPNHRCGDPGGCPLTVIADVRREVAESDEANNSRTFPVW